jgi:hypothetical protein
MAQKECTKCKTTKELNEFYTDARRKQGVTSWCRECWREYERLRRERLGFRGRKNRKLKHMYGISIQEYTAMLKQQDGVCAICGKKETTINAKNSKVQKLCVDHDHITGKVRGLLCTACNKALGLLNDDPSKVIKAHEYLIIHKEDAHDTGRDGEVSGIDPGTAGETTGA